MLSSEYRFPLFDNILYGVMCPFSSSNSCEAYLLKEEPHVKVQGVIDNGIFALSYPKPLNLKCSFYYHRIIRETMSYCNELREDFSTLSDPDIRAYWRLTLLDQHLKTALIKTGEVLREYHLSTADFLAPNPDTDTEKLSNSYIFHLLKICLAKAYLEVQSILEPAPAKQVNEPYLYTGYTGETSPVKTWLRKREISELEKPPPQPKPVEKKSQVVPEKNNTTVTEKTYTLLELTEMKLGSPLTLRRKLVKGELKGYKNGKIWLIEESELKRYLAELKAKTNNK